MKDPQQQQQQKQPTEPSKKSQPNTYMKYSGMGIQTVMIVAVGVLIGTQLDKHLAPNSPTPWYTVGFSSVFVILAMVFMIRQLTRKD